MAPRRRPRALTLTLPDAKQPFLMLEGHRYALRNFSQEGLGLWVPAPPPFGLTPGSKISGDVAIGNEIFPVKLEVRHHSKQVLGLRIEHQSAALTKIFDILLEPATHAVDLVPHADSGKEDPENGFHRLWYVSPSGNELIVWYNDAQKLIQAIQLCWLGRWVYRSQLRLPQTGHLIDGDRKRPGKLVGPSELLLRQEEADEEILQQTALFLGATPPPLPGYRLWQFMEMGDTVFLPEEFFKALKVA